MQAVWIIACALCALTSLGLAILIWRRWSDPPSHLLKWAVLLNPCAVGFLAAAGTLVFVLGRSRTAEVLGEALAGAAAVAFAAHLCLYLAYKLGFGRGRDRRAAG